MKQAPLPRSDLSTEALLARAKRQVARERAARLEAEAIAEKGLRELYESQKRLQLLQRVTEGANKTDQIDAALRLALTEVGSDLGWALGHAYLRRNGKLVVAATWQAVETSELAEFAAASAEMCFEPGVGLPGRVLADPQPHWIEDVTTDTNFPRAPVAARCNMSSACAFPVRVGDEVAAVLEFFTHKRMPASGEVMAILSQVGTQLGRVVERERARLALIHDALHDTLTGLPNRALLGDRLDTAFARASQRPDEQLAILVMDLDGFKAVNDSLGHQAGDALLVNVADQMRDCLASHEIGARQESCPLQCTVARTGGDEFVILVEGVNADRQARIIAHDMTTRLSIPIIVEQRAVSIGASIGGALYRATYKDGGQLIRDADLAMYEAKCSGRGRTVIFCDSLGAKIRDTHSLEQDLRKAIQKDEFELYYQPIVSLATQGTIEGFEALLRWNHPQRGLLSPDAFIELAETTGLILVIGDWVLKEACKTVAGWHRQRPGNKPFISINISPKQFLQPEFGERVASIMFESEIDPTTVRLEVTEGVAIIDADRTRKLIAEIRSWGVKTSLDDFGTGFSSLSYLQTLPFDAIKIDRSFVQAMDGSAQGEGIVCAILNLARTMNMTVIAEGVETIAQQAMLSALGCDFGQGYLFGRPVSEHRALEILMAMPSVVAAETPAVGN